MLDNFNLYLMMEPVLLRAINEQIAPLMTPEQKKINFNKSIIALNDTLIDLIDNTIIPTGNGANVLGVNKYMKNPNIERIIFDL